MTQPQCRACGNRDARELLICQEVGGLHRTTYCCRPGVTGSGCWYATARPRNVETIALLIEATPADRGTWADAWAARRQDRRDLAEEVAS